MSCRVVEKAAAAPGQYPCDFCGKLVPTAPSYYGVTVPHVDDKYSHAIRLCVVEPLSRLIARQHFVMQTDDLWDLGAT